MRVPLAMRYGVLALLLPLVTYAEPVNTNQFGFIRDSMTEAEVVQRLGQPDKVIEEPRTLVKVIVNGRTEYREKQRATYYYEGDSSIMSTYIQFENGRVIGKRKVRE